MSEEIKVLRLYMKSLPEVLPYEQPEHKINNLLSFPLDPEWLGSIGEEATVNPELEGAFWEFTGGRRNEDGTLKIPTRGPAIEKLADIVEFWLEKYPTAFHLQKWVKRDGICFGRDLGSQTAVADAEPSVKKPDTKSGVDTSDPSRDPVSEDEDERNGGRRMDPLLLEVSKAWKTSDGDKKVRCLASAGCDKTWNWPRSKQRILKHAITCGHLAAVNPSLVQRAIEEKAKEDPALLDRLTDKSGLTSKRPRDDPEPGPSAPVDAPPLKRAKGSVATVTPKSAPPPAKGESSSSTKGQLAQYQTEGRKILAQKVNNVLVELFVCCGISPRIISNEEFKKLCNALNPSYNLISRTKFEDSLIPAYAATVRVAVTNYLQTCRFLTLSADEGKLTKKKFVSVNITTVHRQSFCVDLDDVCRISQTGEYFARAFHEDICNIPVFKPIIAELREVLAFMSLSSYSQDWFDLARKSLGISRGLESIGETRFSTIYWSLDSTLHGIPAFTSIVRNPRLVLTARSYKGISWMRKTLMPFARAIQCLESKDTTPADVYLYWLAVVAQLNDLITKDDNAGIKSKYERTVKELIRSIANFRFAQLIEEEQSSNVYFTAFVLDPDNRGASILATPNPLAVKSVAISFRMGEPTVKPQQPLVERIGLSLMKILQREYGNEYRPDRTVEQARTAMDQINPYIAQRAPTDALRALKALAVKLFSSNPVSMPDAMPDVVLILPPLKERPSKPVTVNWRDIRATIHGTPNTDKTLVDSELPGTGTLQPVDQGRDGLSWLDGGLPDLRSTSNRQFDLAAEFDIRQYLDILADSVEGASEVSDFSTSDREPSMEGSRLSLRAAADSFAPKEDEWSS
ncbi:hypothetical protein B0H13DRAFT_2262883 [Mycena leptocephala]|nr:hypothetical protein B0H13DRAFT_2262883 [Mycena leptocephala]